MKKHSFTIPGLLLSFCFPLVSNAQSFFVASKSDTTIVEVPLPLKAYTYNQFVMTDSSLIVTAPNDELDIIIADFKQDKRYYLNFTRHQHIFTQDQEHEINDRASVGIDLTQTNSKHTLYVSNNTSWYYHQAIGTNGIQTHDRKFVDTIALEPKQYHIIQCTSHCPGIYPVHVQLTKGKNTIVETKNITLTLHKAHIQLKCFLQNITNQHYSKEIHYTIQTSKPLPAPIEIEITLHIKIDGKIEIKKDRVILLPTSTTTQRLISIPFTGRCPKVIVDKMFLSNYSEHESIQLSE